MKNAKVKYTKNGYTIAEEYRLLSALREYFQWGATAEQNGAPVSALTISFADGDDPKRKQVTVKNPYAANHLHVQLTGEQIEGVTADYYAEKFKSRGVSGAKEFDVSEMADNAMRLYGHPFHAARILERQRETMAQAGYDDGGWKTGSVISELDARADGTAKTESAGRWGYGKTYDYYDLEKALESLTPISPAGSVSLTADEQAELDARIAKEQARPNSLIKLKFKYSGKEREGYIVTRDWENAGHDDKIDILDADRNPLLNARKKQISIEKKQARHEWDYETEAA